MKKFVKSVLTNDIVVRAAKTFVQAFLAVLAVGVVAVNDWEGVQALVVAAVAAGVSAVWNLVKKKK